MPIEYRRRNTGSAEIAEARTRGLGYFVDCIRDDPPPLSNDPERLQLIRTFVTGTQSLSLKGLLIPLQALRSGIQK